MLARSALLCAALGLALMPGRAAAYVSANGFVVREDSTGTISVMPMGGLGASQAWCAVGQYVNDVKGLMGATRIWRLTPTPRPGGAPMRFSLSSEGSSGDTGLLQLGGADDGSLTLAHARGLCSLLE